MRQAGKSSYVVTWISTTCFFRMKGKNNHTHTIYGNKKNTYMNVWFFKVNLGKYTISMNGMGHKKIQPLELEKSSSFRLNTCYCCSSLPPTQVAQHTPVCGPFYLKMDAKSQHRHPPSRIQGCRKNPRFPWSNPIVGMECFDHGIGPTLGKGVDSLGPID